MELLDFSHPLTISWVKLITQDFVPLSTVQTGRLNDDGPIGARGLQIEYLEHATGITGAQQISTMTTSVDGGETLVPLETFLVVFNNFFFISLNIFAIFFLYQLK